MSDNNGQNKQPDNSYRKRLIEDRFGERSYTLAALFEKAAQQFIDETQGRTDILAELDTRAKQRAAITATVDYIIATEYISLSWDEKRWVINETYKEIFRLGPLDAAISDDSVTEINITGPQDIHIRRGFGDLERYAPTFDTHNHFAQLLQSTLSPLGIDLSQSDPFLEVGLQLEGRLLRFSLIGPPISSFYTGLIRLHPTEPLQLNALHVPPIAVELLQKIVAGGHGLLIIGEGGMGKTTLLANLIQFTSGGGLIQRAHEIHPDYLLDTLKDYTTIPLNASTTAAFEFGCNQALDDRMPTLFIDEIQGDEGGTFWRLLTESYGPQCILTFRGKANVSRLHSAINMAIRKTHRTLPQADINRALMDRLPFAAVLSPPTPKTAPRLIMLGQWAGSGADLTLEPLITWEVNAEPLRTDTPPCRELGE